jgi:hypothetical protein
MQQNVEPSRAVREGHSDAGRIGHKGFNERLQKSAAPATGGGLVSIEDCRRPDWRPRALDYK